MSFTRTDCGISNLPIFLRVDILAFCEGGDGQDRDANDAFGSSPATSPDAAFWQPIIERKHVEKNILMYPLGSKTAVVRAYQKVKGIDTNGLYFCVDQDFDKIFGCDIRDRRVLYTDGYSHENDLVNRCVFAEFFRRFAPEAQPAEQDAFAQNVLQWVTRELSQIRRFIFIDLHRCARSRPLIFTGGLYRHSTLSNSAPPQIDSSALRRYCLHLREDRARASVFVTMQVDSLRHLRGHALMEFVFETIKYYYRQHAGRVLRNKIDEVHFMLVGCFGDMVRSGAVPVAGRY
jgi:hypothetical protein